MWMMELLLLKRMKKKLPNNKLLLLLLLLPPPLLQPTVVCGRTDKGFGLWSSDKPSMITPWQSSMHRLFNQPVIKNDPLDTGRC
jgi:hypothetical protein